MAPANNKPPSKPLEGWQRAAFRAGEIAAMGGLPEEINPHRTGTVEAVSWLAGWRMHLPRRHRRQ